MRLHDTRKSLLINAALTLASVVALSIFVFYTLKIMTVVSVIS
jgi:hypothetical protein